MRNDRNALVCFRPGEPMIMMIFQSVTKARIPPAKAYLEYIFEEEISYTLKLIQFGHTLNNSDLEIQAKHEYDYD